MQPNEVTEIVRRAFPDGRIEVEDLTGTEDHFKIVVASGVFQGKSLIDQHRLVQKAVQAALDSGEIHAVQIRTITLNPTTPADSQHDDFKVIE